MKFTNPVTRRSLLATAAVMTVAVPAQAEECIAPANPGGGWDFTCRQIGKILYDIGAVDNPVQVTNMPGGGLAYLFSSPIAVGLWVVAVAGFIAPMFLCNILRKPQAITD